MNGSPIHALERKPRERCVRMKAKSTFLGWNAQRSPTLVPCSPHDDGPGLPMARARRQYMPRGADHPVDVGDYGPATPGKIVLPCWSHQLKFMAIYRGQIHETHLGSTHHRDLRLHCSIYWACPRLSEAVHSVERR